MCALKWLLAQMVQHSAVTCGQTGLAKMAPTATKTVDEQFSSCVGGSQTLLSQVERSAPRTEVKLWHHPGM